MKRTTGLMTGMWLATAILLGETALAQSGETAVSQVSSTSARAGRGGFLGVFLANVDGLRARELKMREVRGAIVGQVLRDSPAEKAGLKENDVILSYNENSIQRAAQIYQLLAKNTAGQVVNLEIFRDEKMMVVPVTVAERPIGIINSAGGGQDEGDLYEQQAEKLLKEADELRQQAENKNDSKLLTKAEERVQEAELFRKLAADYRADVEKNRKTGKQSVVNALRNSLRLEVKVIPLTEQLGKHFNVSSKSGVLITEVEENSVASQVGLQVGDCLLEVNEQKVQSASDLTKRINETLAQARSNPDSIKEIRLRIMRAQSAQTITIDLAQR